ncbi:MAG: hypothetical protein N2C12_09340, partial [Planctomycetales bacterium]
LIAGHVAGNAIGTRLRDQGSRGVDLPPKSPAGLPTLITPRFHHRSKMGKLILIFTAGGSLLGILVGRHLFSLVDHGQFAGNDWSLAIASFAVLGGLFGFLATCFFREGFLPAVVCFFRRSVKN